MKPRNLEAGGDAGFADIDGSFAETHINALAAARITAGCHSDPEGPRRFCPNDVVTRGQMAVFLARALRLIDLPGPPGFTMTDSGYQHACGLRADGTVVCWGDNSNGQADSPDENFKAVTASRWHSCGLRTDDTVACWGNNDDRRSEPPESWGESYAGKAYPPQGRSSSVSGGAVHSCGVREDGTIVCRGASYLGQAEPPDGSFTKIASSSHHSCALTVEEAVVCWGLGGDHLNAPEGRFAEVAAGYEFSCGIRADSTLVCWSNFSFYTTVPDGSFLTIDAGPYHACGVRVEVQFTPLHRWLRAEQGHAHYAGGGIDAEAVRLADPEFDFSEQDIVMTIRPSSHFGDGNALGFVQTQEGTRLTPRVNFTPVTEPRPPLRWEAVGAHEFLHTLGLLDMYPSDFSVYEQPEAPAGQAWIESRFGILLVRAFFLASEQDSRLAHVWHYPDGQSTAYSRTLDAQEMLAWSRWQLGWLQADEILCMTDSEATVALHPVAADPDQGTAMAAIPLSAHEVVVIESRRTIGLDAGVDHVEPNGVRTTFPGLGSEGVLVYTVDAALGGGQLPIKVAGDSGNGRFDTYPVLSVGQSVTVRGYTITVVSDNGETHTLEIAQAADA